MQTKKMILIGMAVSLVFTGNSWAIESDGPEPAKTVVIGDFIRNADGSVRLMDQYQAENACCMENGKNEPECNGIRNKFKFPVRLPTAREFAEEAVAKYGATMLEEADFNPEKLPEGFTISDFNFVKGTTDGTEDRFFYYSQKHYQKPEGEIAQYRTWSSTHTHYYDHIAYYFYGGRGDIYSSHRDTRSNNFAARCVRGNVTELAAVQCKKISPLAPVGTVCKTKKGFIFKRYIDQETGESGWLDETSKEIWFDDIKDNVNHSQSMSFCSSVKNQSLPTKAGFIGAEFHGFREVFKDMNDRWFWSSSKAVVK